MPVDSGRLDVIASFFCVGSWPQLDQEMHDVDRRARSQVQQEKISAKALMSNITAHRPLVLCLARAWLRRWVDTGFISRSVGVYVLYIPCSSIAAINVNGAAGVSGIQLAYCPPQLVTLVRSMVRQLTAFCEDRCVPPWCTVLRDVGSIPPQHTPLCHDSIIISGASING